MVWTPEKKDGEDTMSTMMPIESQVGSGTGPRPSALPVLNVPVDGEQQSSQETPAPQAAEPTVPPMINPSSLLSAQAEFLDEQSIFLDRGVGTQGDVYNQAISRFSRAQGRLIRAQNRVLRQAGIV
jgi:hypothetical protein